MPHRKVYGLLVLWSAVAALAGYLLVPSRPKQAPPSGPSTCRGVYPPRGLKLPSPWTYRRGQELKLPTPSHNYVLPPWIPLNREQAELVAISPEEVRRRMKGPAKKHQEQLCRTRIRDLPAERCAEVADISSEEVVARFTIYRRFLSRQIDQDRLQDDYHRAQLEQIVRLEHLLTENQVRKLLGMGGGDDPFLVTVGWGMNLPPNWKVGDDVISGETADAPPEAATAAGTEGLADLSLPPPGAGPGSPGEPEPSDRPTEPPPGSKPGEKLYQEEQ